MVCGAQQRSRLRRVGTVLDDMQGVRGHTLCSPAVGNRDRWTLKVTLVGGGVPSAVLSILARYGCQLGASQPQGEWWQFVATIE